MTIPVAWALALNCHLLEWNSVDPKKLNSQRPQHSTNQGPGTARWHEYVDSVNSRIIVISFHTAGLKKSSAIPIIHLNRCSAHVYDLTSTPITESKNGAQFKRKEAFSVLRNIQGHQKQGEQIKFSPTFILSHSSCHHAIHMNSSPVGRPSGLARPGNGHHVLEFRIEIQCFSLKKPWQPCIGAWHTCNLTNLTIS